MSDGVPLPGDGPSSRYWCATPLKTVTPAARLTTESAEPSPQLIVTVCLSSVPGPTKVPPRVVLPFSLILLAPRLRVTSAVSTFSPLAVLPFYPAPPSSSATVAEIVYTSEGVPLPGDAPSSRYVCATPPKLVSPAARLTTVFAEPSP